jgi:hypothetical protein
MEDRYEAERKKMKERQTQIVITRGKRAEINLSTSQRNQTSNSKHFANKPKI